MLKFQKKKRKTVNPEIDGGESKSKKVKKQFKKRNDSLIINDEVHADVQEIQIDDNVYSNSFRNVTTKKTKSKMKKIKNSIVTENTNQFDANDPNGEDKRNNRKTKDKIKKKKRNLCSTVDETSAGFPAAESTDVCEAESTPQLKKKKKDKNYEILEDDSAGQSENKSFDEKQNRKRMKHDDDDHSSKSTRKEFTRQKLTDERLRKGLVMLSPKVESKIYKLKKALKRKGLPTDEIRQIVRQRRRTEELKLRPGDVCYRCRQPGHRFADCQLVVRDEEQGTGVCFRCGSTEHILRDCTSSRAKKGRLPYAKCFVCGLQGHISRECPSNPKGAFPKGGKCNVCGSINHLKKDCPQLINTQDEDFVTAKVMRTGFSADALDDE